MTYQLPPPVSATGNWCTRCETHLAEGVKTLCPVCLDDAHRESAELDGAA